MSKSALRRLQLLHQSLLFPFWKEVKRLGAAIIKYHGSSRRAPPLVLFRPALRFPLPAPNQAFQHLAAGIHPTPELFLNILCGCSLFYLTKQR